MGRTLLAFVQPVSTRRPPEPAQAGLVETALIVEPQVLGHLPFLAVAAFAAAGFLSLRLVIAITRSGHL